MGKVARGERILEEIAAKTKLSPHGKEFLIANLDPMHDNQLERLSGWPDVEGAASIVRCVKQTVEIKKPVGLTGNWDCHIIAWPFLHSTPGGIANFADGCYDNPSTIRNASLGGVQAYAASSGVVMDILSPAPMPPFQVVAELSLDPTYDRGVGRMVGAGLEVVNTTADLNRQGLVTVYRSSQQKESDGSVLWYNVTPAFNQTLATKFFRPPPNKLSDVTTYPGTRQWKAEEGAYVVYPFIGGDNAPRGPVPCTPAVVPDFSYSTSVEPDQVKVGWLGNVRTVGSAKYSIPFKAEFVHQPGIYFTGLSENSTLSLTWNVYYETFPGKDEKDILVLATPSGNYDPVALELLNRALASLPVGVPASMNPSGEWFWDIVSKLADLAAPIGTALGGPLGGIIGAGVGSLGKNVSGYMTAPSPNSKPKVQQVNTQTKRKPLPPIPNKKR